MEGQIAEFNSEVLCRLAVSSHGEIVSDDLELPQLNKRNPPFRVSKSMPLDADAELVKSLVQNQDSSLLHNIHVVARRACLRSIVKPLLFQPGSYFLDNLSSFEAIMVENVLVITRAEKPYTLAPTFGTGFEKAMVHDNSTPGYAALYNVTRLSSGGMDVVVRSEIDCYEGLNAIELTTKKLKPRKGRFSGFYPLLNADLCREKCLQMLLAKTDTLLLGARLDSENTAEIRSIETHSINELARAAGISSADQASIVHNLFEKLKSFRVSLQQSSQVGKDGTKQGNVTFCEASHEYKLQILPVDSHTKYSWVSGLREHLSQLEDSNRDTRDTSSSSEQATAAAATTITKAPSAVAAAVDAAPIENANEATVDAVAGTSTAQRTEVATTTSARESQQQEPTTILPPIPPPAITGTAVAPAAATTTSALASSLAELSIATAAATKTSASDRSTIKKQLSSAGEDIKQHSKQQ